MKGPATWPRASALVPHRNVAGLRPGPRPLSGPCGPPGGTPSGCHLRWHLWYARLVRGRSSLAAARWAAPRPFLRTPRALLRRGPCPCAGPLRRGAPAAASRPQSGLAALPSVAGAGPRGSPPALSLGLSSAGAPAPAPPGSRWPRLVPGSPPLCCGLPPLRSGRPCSALAPRAPARGPAGPPPPRPLRGFGPGGFRPRGPRGLWPRLWWLSPPGPPARPRLRGLAVRVGSFLLCLGPVVVPGSPLASPPPLPPPLGAGGEHGARMGGLRAPTAFGGGPPGAHVEPDTVRPVRLPLHFTRRSRPRQAIWSPSVRTGPPNRP